jgi:hypothetical protein
MACSKRQVPCVSDEKPLPAPKGRAHDSPASRTGPTLVWCCLLSYLRAHVLGYLSGFHLHTGRPAVAKGSDPVFRFSANTRRLRAKRAIAHGHRTHRARGDTVRPWRVLACASLCSPTPSSLRALAGQLDNPPWLVSVHSNVNLRARTIGIDCSKRCTRKPVSSWHGAGVFLVQLMKLPPAPLQAGRPCGRALLTLHEIDPWGNFHDGGR